MRGLPRVPVDVLQLRQTFDINGHQTSCGWWLWNPSNADILVPEAAEITGLFLATCLPSLLELMHDGVSATTCLLTGNGLSYSAVAPPNHGAWAGGQAVNVATGLHWLTGERGALAGPITYVPGVPDVFISDNWRLSQLAIGNLRASSTDLYNAFNELPSPDGTPEVVGTVQRARHGVPLDAAVFAPYFGVVPTQKVVTIRRRIPHGRAVSPS